VTKTQQTLKKEQKPTGNYSAIVTLRCSILLAYVALCYSTF